MTTNQSSYSPLRTIVLVCVCFIAMQGSEVEAFSQMYPGLHPYTGPDSCGYGVSLGISDPMVTINYPAVVTLTKSAQPTVPISSGTTVNVGDILSFSTPFQDTDISWFGTGYADDSPFGSWVSGAVPTDSNLYSRGESVIWYCDANDQLYVLYSVNTPDVTFDHYGSSAGLNCNNNGSVCTVTSAGSVVMNVVFAETYGKFNGLNDFWYWGVSWWNAYYGTTLQVVYTLSTHVIPSETLHFTFTAVSSNNPPTAPTIVGPTTGEPSTSYSFSLTATDPDNDTIRYGLDWNNDTLVDQWVPSSGYINSGTSQSVNKLWPAVGTYTFKALTEDVNSGRSGWTSHTITIANSCAIGIINNCGVMETPSGGNSGTCTVSGTCNYTCTNGAWSQNNNSCVVPKCSDGIDNDSPLDGFIDYGSGPLNDPGCSSSIDTDEYNALTPPELTTTARVVDPGPSGVPIDLIWDTNNGNEALCSLTGGLIATNPLDPANTNIPIGNVDTGSTTVTISARTTYTLTCPNGTDTTMVEVVPRGTET